MKNFQNKITQIAGAVIGRNRQKIGLILTLALFVLGAIAPNATIGIGK